MSWLRYKLFALPEVEAESIPELFLTNATTTSDILKLSKNMRRPVIIRGALRDSIAVKRWSESFLKSTYGNEQVVVNELDRNSIRMQIRTVKEYFKMQDEGRNVSIAGSSSIFHRNKAFRADLHSPYEVVGPKGQTALANEVGGVACRILQCHVLYK
jgi:hypothetical protein